MFILNKYSNHNQTIKCKLQSKVIWYHVDCNRSVTIQHSLPATGRQRVEILLWQQPPHKILGAVNSAWSCWSFDVWIWWWWNFPVEQGVHCCAIHLCKISTAQSSWSCAFLLLFYWCFVDILKHDHAILRSRQLFIILSSVKFIVVTMGQCTLHIHGNREYSCKLKFKEQSILDWNPRQVSTAFYL